MQISKESLSQIKELFSHRDLVGEWNSRPHRREMPGISELKHLSIDIERLRKDYLEIKRPRVDLYESNYIETLSDVDQGYSSRYYAGVLTRPSARVIKLQEQIDIERGVPWYQHSAQLSRKQVLKSLKYLNEDYDPLVDERNHSELAQSVQGSYLEKLLFQIKGRVTRCRFGSLSSGEGLKPHKDVIPRYACRIHIPLYSNPLAFSFSYSQGLCSTYHLEVGKAYILNGGLLQWAHNFGNSDRIHLVISVDGVEDWLETLEVE